ncbi:hypothetical protein H5V45_16585 [Nocardioides sp. KIGAM211]|uniref:Lipoprotein n=1 Tax=Nocardioides luti TaxID=2761101 RepID=A0A7X0RIG8_9ACTN|nr:hypothetical protein [Nocardioides luti]MBB6628944.1 hypothetical protein [Nocardioides luti]
MRTLTAVAAVVAATSVAGCRGESGGTAPDDVPPTPVVEGAHAGSLTAEERALATSIAQHRQRQVEGTFVGATAVVTRGTPFDPGSACNGGERWLDIRLVWESPADFVHSGMPGAPPDGPRQALLLVADPVTGHLCQTAAMYRDVGAGPDEALLYGAWPDPADS